MDIEIQNPAGKWVVTEVLLEVNYKPTENSGSSAFHIDSKGQMQPGPAPNKSGAKTFNYQALDGYLRTAPSRVVVKSLIQPGNKQASVVEIGEDSQVSHVLVIEARGREQTTFERLKSAVQ